MAVFSCPPMSSYVLILVLWISSLGMRTVLLIPLRYIRSRLLCFSEHFLTSKHIKHTSSTSNHQHTPTRYTENPPSVLQNLQHQLQWITSKHQRATWLPALPCRHTLRSSRRSLLCRIQARRFCRPQRLNSASHLHTWPRPLTYHRMLFLSFLCQP